MLFKYFEEKIQRIDKENNRKKILTFYFLHFFDFLECAYKEQVSGPMGNLIDCRITSSFLDSIIDGSSVVKERMMEDYLL
jgi:hypothetical protein